MNPFLSIAHEQIHSLIPYKAGLAKNSLQDIEPDNIIKLASNENPLGTSDKVKQAISSCLNDLHLYPEQMEDMLSHLSKHLKVSQAQCILGSGSENIIAMLTQVFNKEGNHFLIPQYAFSAFKTNAKAHNANVISIPMPNYQLTVDDILSKVNEQTSLIYLDNPNNPLGGYLTHNEIETILAHIPPTTILILDEAYYEYASNIASYPKSLELLKKFSNLIILRTFSKAYGLGGLRIGYGISCPDIIELLNRVRFPFNVSSLSLVAAKTAIDDQNFVQQSVSLNTTELEKFKSFFKDSGISYLPTVSNFITINLEQPSEVLFYALLKAGIIVRTLTPYGLNNHIRISIGTEAQNARLMDAIKKFQAGEL